MNSKTELLSQIKSSDYPENTVMDFVLRNPCKKIFINNSGPTVLQMYFKTINASGYFRQMQIDAKSGGEIPFEIHKIKELRIETELGHDFKIETYI